MWEEMGSLQLEFMCSQGLRPHHQLLDMGCGALRAGLFFIRYLDSGNYFGLDINTSLIEAGRKELANASLNHRTPRLLVDDQFRASRFGVTFDFAIAQSLFTHLTMNHIINCIAEVRGVLKEGGQFYATFFEAPSPAHTSPILQIPGEVETHHDRDPFHYSIDEIRVLAELAGTHFEYLGDWSHPRAQKMVRITNLG